MKFAITADIHLSGYTNDKIIEKLPERLFSIKNVLYNIAEYCVKNNIGTLVIAGDTLHGKSMIHALAQAIMLNFFRDYAGKLEVIIIDGNHDKSGKGQDAISALMSLDNEPNVMRFEGPTMIGDVFFVPYSYDMVNIIKSGSAKYLVSHFGLDEGMLNSGISIVADISISDLIGKYKNVLLGHYHKAQEIIREDIKLWYIGSPIQIDWGEKNEEKRFMIIDTENDDIQSIETTGYTKYCEFIITEENREELAIEAKKLTDEGHFVKILKKDKDVNISGFEEFTIIDKTERDITNRGVSSTMSMDEKLKRFLEVREINEESIPHFLQAANIIIERASELQQK